MLERLYTYIYIREKERLIFVVLAEELEEVAGERYVWTAAVHEGNSDKC